MPPRPAAAGDGEGTGVGPLERLDVVLLGASGFTGRYIAAELSAVAAQLGLRVGVAGRDTRRLRQLLGSSVSSQVSVLHADISSTVSLNRLCQRATVLINATGPYHELGWPVVRACLRAGTHYVDICGERLFAERCQVELHDQAERSGVYLVSTCGFDSIPAELGSVLLQRALPGGLSGFRCYLHMQPGAAGYRGVHLGTWLSSIHGTACVLPVLRLQRRLFPAPLPAARYPLRSRGLLHRAAPLGDRWCLPFLGPDVLVHQRSAAWRLRHRGTPPAQMQQYVAVAGFWRGLVIALTAVLFGLLCFLPGGQWLLRAFPERLSAGLISRRGPSAEQVRQTRFTVVCEGEGWRQPDAAGPPDTRRTLRMQFPEAAYLTTALCVVQCAVCLLRETDRMPGRGGALPPGAAFGDTTLDQRLQARGVQISLESEQAH
ncbi:saccharopine dehydrogenase-like oxidoreductase [Amphibalanus amphitrite]|uniref:saccharopine dehydrogenase-like oxidoreductase n=1 Tax=Amphibalanus amphitrite TaxID=1232801 RepID=UPI001C8FAC00|nr:saccharopine dehydrogenase-like oxidoreductase [Amphibalanus amphitrite]